MKEATRGKIEFVHGRAYQVFMDWALTEPGDRKPCWQVIDDLAHLVYRIRSDHKRHLYVSYADHKNRYGSWSYTLLMDSFFYNQVCNNASKWATRVGLGLMQGDELARELTAALVECKSVEVEALDVLFDLKILDLIDRDDLSGSARRERGIK